MSLSLLRVTDRDPEEVAFDLLNWNPYSLPAEFDDEQAMLCVYSKLQKQRSDAALDDWDKAHPYEASDELTAFRELERLGVYTSRDFFSPSKAKNGHYSARLKQIGTTPGKPDRSQGTARKHRSVRRHGSL